MSRKKHFSIDGLSVTPVYLSARSAIIAPEQAIPVTIYALKKWLPRLGPDRWSLVQLLRGLCFDAPRRPDGTKRVVISWRHLAECLQVHEETIASWLKHQVMPDDKPWRRIIPTDDFSEYLSLFIPRLRYAYETSNGKTRRVGFLLEVLMEDPIAPEDEIQLAQQVELLQMQQGELGLETYRLVPEVNSMQSNLPGLQGPKISTVNRSQVGSPDERNSNQQGLTPSFVNPDNSDLQTTVKQHNPDLATTVSTDNSDSRSDLQYGKSEWIANNVNKLNSLINQLTKLKHRKRNYQQILEPVITLTETLLDDYHSTAMLYKVLKVLFPHNIDIYISSVEQSLMAFAFDSKTNKGAFFVKTLRELAENRDINLGFRQSQPSSTSTKNGDFVIQHSFMDPPQTKLLQASVEDVVWSETLTVLQGEMTRAMFDSVMQGTELIAIENGVYLVQVATSMAKDWLDNRLKGMVERALSNVIGTSVHIEFRL